MENSLGVVAVFAVSGSIVLLARQLHKRLLSDFMKQIEGELCGAPEKCRMMMKKKVRFAEDVVEPSSNNEEYRKRHVLMMMTKHEEEKRVWKEGKFAMRRSRQVL